MSEPIFLTLAQVLQLHTESLDRFGGSDGVRDINLIESAIYAPQQSFGGEYAHPDIVSMAAAYLYHLTKNHGFVDGNKRTGFLAAYTFLGVNGYDLDFPEIETEQLVLGVAEGKVSKDEVAAFIRKLCDGMVQ